MKPTMTLLTTAMAVTSAMDMSTPTPTLASAMSPLLVHSDLFYATATACDQLTTLPSSQELSEQLLPEDSFRGHMTVTTSAPKDGQHGCVLHVAVDGEIVVAPSSTVENVFDLTDSIDQKLAALAESQYLRGATHGLKDLTLQSVTVKINNRDYSIALQSTSAQNASSPSNLLTLNGGQCDPLAGHDLLNSILPKGAVVDDLHVLAGGDGASADCAVGFDVMASAPLFASNNEAFAFLKAVDDNLNALFEPSTAPTKPVTSLTSANLKFQTAKDENWLIAAPNELNLASSSMNMPTKEITLSILIGISVLSAMLFAIVYQKKRHEQRCQERHDLASKAAQIRRVSYRMGYDPLASHELEEKDEEKSGLL
ncbi:hypothetical protein Poli38472_006233 [Pythium oligandrum]|uniref:Uncharacterized protein n=1 Tax=Pythium oligandrum TaxID=41045 RepID=A0A8K1CU78_PYTOL|nr:hypothetical protein Poli38472_006233 [Pythium oligandrum]|eukprot:TMW68765.1 hypothetical protein Poli38472_006233 [Pythium oligandrum]